MNVLNLTCLCILIASILLVFIALGTCIVLSVKSKKKKEDARRMSILPFHIFLIIFYIAAVIVFFPIYYFDYRSAGEAPLQFINSVLLAAQNVLRLITLNGEFDNIKTFLFGSNTIVYPLAQCYSVYTAIICIAAPLLTASFIISFFHNTLSMIRYTFKPCKKLYVMSELNEKSLALAKSILEDSTIISKKEKRVVFTNVFEKESNGDLIFEANKLGALCIKKEVTSLNLKFKRKCERKVYLISENEDKNVEQALELINLNRIKCEDKKDIMDNLQLYVFATSAESGILLDRIDKGNIKVRRFDKNFNLAIYEMKKHDIFNELVLQQDKDDAANKLICIALIGLGGYGLEFLKMICCLGQMPGYSVEVHVFDKAENLEDRVKAVAPEFILYNDNDIPTESKYKIVFHNLVDVKSSKFIEEFLKIQNYTGVYVLLGDDETNIDTAMRISIELKRHTSKIIPIYSLVYDNIKSDILKTVEINRGSLNKDMQPYDITFIGGIQEIYSLDNIEQNEVEELAKKVHTRWIKLAKNYTEAEKPQMIENANIQFNQFEYYRKSSTVRSVYLNLRNKLKIKKRENEESQEDALYNDKLREYEHRRWNVFMRGEGWIYNKKRKNLTKMHNLLLPFNQLPSEEKEKDDF